MSTGLVFGKFMPVHNGHLALISFAAARCDRLLVVLCAEPTEIIPGELRLEWLRSLFADDPAITLVYLPYDPAILPNTSESSSKVAAKWAKTFQEILPPVDVTFTSEPYGDFVAEFMGIRHVAFDPPREKCPISASQIRQTPWRYWEQIPAVARPYFVTKIAIHGTESTGKSTLAERLAAHYHAAYVPEIAREIVTHTSEVTPANLTRIALAHAAAIEEKRTTAKRLLFVDTTLDTTRSYSRFLFGQELQVPPAAATANNYALHLYCSANAPYVQDGTRLTEDLRQVLDQSHRQVLTAAGIELHQIHGTAWAQRLTEATQHVDKLLASRQ